MEGVKGLVKQRKLILKVIVYARRGGKEAVSKRVVEIIEIGSGIVSLNARINDHIREGATDYT